MHGSTMYHTSRHDYNHNKEYYEPASFTVNPRFRDMSSGFNQTRSISFFSYCFLRSYWLLLLAFPSTRYV